MPNLANIDKLKSFRLLQVGESGKGKTTRALSATRFGKMFVYDFDDKLTQLAPKLTSEQRALVDFETFQDFGAADKHLRDLLNQKPFPYASVVVDTWSRLHDLEIDHHKKLNPRVKKFSFDDWGQIKAMNREYMGLLLQLPCNLIVNCHVGKRMDAQDNVVLTVGTTGSFGQEMPQYFQETHFLYFEMGKFKVKGAQTSRIIANTGRPESMYDKSGIFHENDLSIFDDIAYRVPA